MRKTAHTPTPWEIRDVPSRERFKITDSTGYTIAEMPSYPIIEKEEANAAYIVRAVNAHEALLEALEQCLTLDGATAERSHTMALKRLQAINEIATAAIAKAKGA